MVRSDVPVDEATVNALYPVCPCTKSDADVEAVDVPNDEFPLANTVKNDPPVDEATVKALVVVPEALCT